MADERFVPDIGNILRSSGWHENRSIRLSSISLSKEYEIFPEAEEILKEFGGLHIGMSGRGPETNTNDIIFVPCEGDLGCSKKTKFNNIYPLGSFHRRHGAIYIDGNKIVYVFWIAESDDVECLNLTFNEVFPRMLLGIKWW